MTNEEIVELFPENEKVKKSDIAPCVEMLFDLDVYNKIYSTLIHYINRHYWPAPDGFCEEYRDFVYGKPLMNWYEMVEREFVERKGEWHTFRDAGMIAANEWIRLIFGKQLQDNGDDSYSGGMMMILGTVVKNDMSEKYGERFIEKLRKLIFEYYTSDIHKAHCGLYCDYSPDKSLHDLAVKAGMDRRDIQFMFPWKTSISVDRLDHKVKVDRQRGTKYL